MFSKLIHRLASVRLRLTLLFTLVFGLTMGGFGYATIEFLRQSLAREFDDALYNYAVDVLDSVTLDSSGNFLLAPPQIDRVKIYPFALGNALVQIKHRSGAILSQVGLWGDFKVPNRNEHERLSKGEEAIFSTIRDLSGLPMPESASYRVIYFPIDAGIPPQLVLQIAVPMTLLEKQLTSRHFAFQVGIPLVLLVTTWLGYLLAARALQPLTQIIGQAKDIGVQELSRRLPIPETEDEVRDLALTLNQMLERIERAFQSQEKFVADASHQLLTPLTVMKGALEASQRQGDMGREGILSCLQEVDRLTSLVRNLLSLARMDAGLGALRFEAVYLDEIIVEAISKIESVARLKEIRIKFDMKDLTTNQNERPAVNGEEGLLVTLVFNLLENAVKYSPSGSMIRIEHSWDHNSQVIRCEDSGPGVPSDLRDLIFERFQRGHGDALRTPGFGLGLAICKKIAEVHGGKLWIEPRSAENTIHSPGTVFLFEIKNF